MHQPGGKKKIHDLESLLEAIESGAGGSDNITIDAVMKATGKRSFGPMLLVPGLIALSPLSGIPGMPTIVGIMTLLIAGQLLIGRSEFWLPQFILRRSISRPRFQTAVGALRKVARFIDRLIKPRLTVLTSGAATYTIAGLCVVLASIAPLLELLPFVITGVGAALTALGLALISHDGLLALLALGFLAIAGTVTINTVL